MGDLTKVGHPTTPAVDAARLAPARGEMSTSLFTRDDPAWAVAATVLAMVLASVFFFANALRRRTGAAREPAPAGGAKSTNPVDPAKENERDATEHTPYRIADLYIYPIKSCAGERVKTARTCATGFEQDRRYMVINAKVRLRPCERAFGAAILTPFASPGSLYDPTPVPQNGTHPPQTARQGRCAAAPASVPRSERCH